MFDSFSLPDLLRVSRHTMLGALAVGVVGLAVCLFLDLPWVGVGLCIGLAIGLGNFRMAQRSVVRVSERRAANTRRPLALNTFSRMVLVTVVALGLLFVDPPLALGLIGGLALFQLLLLANVTRSMLKMGAVPSLASFGLDAGDEPATAVAEDDEHEEVRR